MTQVELARRADVSPRSVVSWELGKNQPNGKFLDRLADALGVSPGWLADGMDETEKARAHESTPVYRTAPLPVWLRDINARILAMDAPLQALAVERINALLSQLVHRRPSIPDKAGNDPVYQTAVDATTALAMRRAIQGEAREQPNSNIARPADGAATAIGFEPQIQTRRPGKAS